MDKNEKNILEKMKKLIKYNVIGLFLILILMILYCYLAFLGVD